MASSTYLRLLIFLLAILILAYASPSPAFLMMYSVYKLNKHCDNIQPWLNPFPIWNQSVVPCPVPTVASWPAYRFLKRQVRWSGILTSFRIFLIVIHTVKEFDIVNKAEIDVFLELSCFFSDPADVGNLISGSSAFSKSSLNIWKFTVHVLLKPLTVWITINCGKFWKRWEYQTSWPTSWETYMQVRKQQLELDMEQQTGSK